MHAKLFATDRGPGARPMARLALWQARHARLAGRSNDARAWLNSAARYRTAGR